MPEHRTRLRVHYKLGKFCVSFLLLLISIGCGHPTPTPDPTSPSAENDHVTFVQWSDPHLFDAGASRVNSQVEEEGVDNMSSLHWAVLQTNRLVREDHQKIDFVVITGDFGLYNVTLNELGFPGKQGSTEAQGTCTHDPKEGPGLPVPMTEAADLMARELRALEVQNVFLLPGNNDLCNEDPRNRYRYALFVLELQRAMQRQQADRKEELKTAQKIINEQKKKGVKIPILTLPDKPPVAPEVEDLTHTLEFLLRPNPPNLRSLLLTNSSLPTRRQAQSYRNPMLVVCALMRMASCLL